MNPQRWQQISHLYQAALERDANRRASFLNEACRGDEDLRREVESLLAQVPAEEEFLNAPAMELAGAMMARQTAEPLIGREVGAYRIESLLGAGGMGTVYRARDLHLGRDVAVKVLPDGFAHDRQRVERFRREAHLLAALNHPNITTIYGLEHSEGALYLVMELVPGETLAERIARGHVAVEETTRIAAQLAEALGAAHQRGITHRDIKPANIKITPDGRVKVLDFGLAKALVRHGSEDVIDNLPTVTALSQPGLMLGTPAYMSPEQVRGLPSGEPADIWGFGCVLYELLAGRPPFAAASVAEVVASVLKTDPDWNALQASTPGTIRQLLTRCLQKDAQLRLADIREAYGVLEQATRSQPGAPSDHAIRCLAVLPFANVSGDPQMDYLGDGLTESIILTLSKLPQLRVLAQSSVFQYRGQHERAREIGRSLGVEAVVTGRVLQRGQMLRISAELVDVEFGWQLWGGQYRRTAADIFDAEEEITREISENLRLKLSQETEKHLTHRHTNNVEAYHLYLKGRFYWAKRTADGLNKGLQYFRQAIECDPTYALAYAGLAEGYIPQGVYCHAAPTEAFPRARTAAERALEIDPDLSEAITVLGSVRAGYDWDLDAAEALQRTAIERNPSYPRARQVLADCLEMQGRFDESAAEIKRGLELDPLALYMNAAVVMNHYFGRRFEAAARHGNGAVELDPTFYPTHFYLGLAYQATGQFPKAVAALQLARQLSGDSTLMIATLGGAFAAWGKEEDARGILGELGVLAERRYVSQTFVAAIHAGLGDRERALASLEQARKDRCWWLLRCLLLDARLDTLRDEPRFQALIGRRPPSI
jgi:serine/threonine protein kinase/Flp pilus assembly protein TadD